MTPRPGDMRALATIESGVAIPLLQAGVTGAFVGILGGSVAVLAGGRFWEWSLLSGSVAALGAWYAGVSAWRSAIGMTAQPEPVPIVYQSEAARLKLSIDWDSGQAGLFAELNITDEQFIAWACGAARGQSLGENHWTGTAGVFSKGVYHQLINRLMFHGLVKRAGKARNQGYMLSSKGRAVCSAILDRYGNLPSPTNQSYLPGGSNRL